MALKSSPVEVFNSGMLLKSRDIILGMDKMLLKNLWGLVGDDEDIGLG